jgi:Uma2 family endonuclease
VTDRLARRSTVAYAGRMSSRPTPWSDPVGPFRSDQIHEGDHYELSDGHAIHCMTAGRRHGGAHAAGAMTLATAAATPQQTGIDVGVSFNDRKNLRAPDIVVGLELDAPGWAGDAPPLAVEYADAGQDEAELQQKIVELLALGTRQIWVVRLTGPLRVEVYQPDAPMRLVDADGELAAPGILLQAVPVRALIDHEIAVEATLHNILARKGYRDLAEVRAEGHSAGVAEGVAQGIVQGVAQGVSEGVARHNAESCAHARALLRAHHADRGWTLSPALQARLDGCDDLPTLMRWLTQVGAADVEAALR